MESLLSPFLFGLRDLWNPVELTVCRVWWPRTPARNFVFSCTAVKMLIDNCVAPLTTAPPLSQAVASLCILYISNRAILHPFLRVCVYILTLVHPRSKFKTTREKHNKPYFHFLETYKFLNFVTLLTNPTIVSLFGFRFKLSSFFASILNFSKILNFIKLGLQ